MRGKHAARAQARRSTAEQQESERLRAEVRALKDELVEARRRVRHVQAVEKELAHHRSLLDGDALIADLAEAVGAARSSAEEAWALNIQMTKELYDMARKLQPMLGLDRPAMVEFVQRHVPSATPPTASPVARTGVQNDHLDAEAVARIQRARGIRRQTD